MAQRLYFLEQGLVRGYALHAGQEVSSWFTREDDFVYAQSEQRAYQLRTLPAAARYAQLVQDFPGLAQRVPLKYLAFHLGIAPETLSRLRAKRT